MKKRYSLFFFTIILLCQSFGPARDLKYKVRTVVIDAGHGGKDPGCKGQSKQEKQVTLQVALELGKLIKKNYPDVRVLYTRMSDNFVELHERAAIANRNNADLFISIHCNSGPGKVSGTETYTMGLHTSDENLEVAKRENEVIVHEKNYKGNYDGYDPKSPVSHIMLSNYQHAHMANSLKFAQLIEEQFKVKLKRNSRGVKQAGLLVLWKTTMPGVLIEIGFLTNKQEESYLSNAQNRGTIASGIFRAFKSYKTDMEKSP
ncbi:MAG: N-acetylmuramoyl-L-alanine amidase [Cytophagaceae bacterium]|jgi:N-acetylmuramoyl-L-alanine amidase|nr:N-acetylmuramoyl-L-alanine amidase [Cytophagaceae bacterium]